MAQESGTRRVQLGVRVRERPLARDAHSEKLRTRPAAAAGSGRRPAGPTGCPAQAEGRPVWCFLVVQGGPHWNQVRQVLEQGRSHVDELQQEFPPVYVTPPTVKPDSLCVASLTVAGPVPHAGRDFPTRASPAGPPRVGALPSASRGSPGVRASLALVAVRTVILGDQIYEKAT